MWTKTGIEKIHFVKMSNQVANSQFEYLRDLFLKCLNENQNVAKKLDQIYEAIHVCIYNEAIEANVVSTLREILNDETLIWNLKPTPAFAQSRRNVGCIMLFTKYLDEYTKNRTDIRDTKNYHKNGLFEEICHLVEQNGDSSIHPREYWELWQLYGRKGLNQQGNEIIARLDTDRNHYQVYGMMIRSYPDDWVARCYKFFNEPVDYQEQYSDWKKSAPLNIAYARLVTDYLQLKNVQLVSGEVAEDRLSEENRKKLRLMINDGRKSFESKQLLINDDLGSTALELLGLFNEEYFETSQKFFSAILDLWKSLALI